MEREWRGNDRYFRWQRNRDPLQSWQQESVAAREKSRKAYLGKRLG
jgi:hypothetical protein